MNREEVIRMAREAGFRTGELHMQDGSGSWTFVTPIGDGCIVELEKFAALVVASERDACASLCDGLVDYQELEKARKRLSEAQHSGDDEDELRAMRHELNVSTFNAGIKSCAKAIRARGVQPKD